MTVSCRLSTVNCQQVSSGFGLSPSFVNPTPTPLEDGSGAEDLFYLFRRDAMFSDMVNTFQRPFKVIDSHRQLRTVIIRMAQIECNNHLPSGGRRGYSIRRGFPPARLRLRRAPGKTASWQPARARQNPPAIAGAARPELRGIPRPPAVPLCVGPNSVRPGTSVAGPYRSQRSANLSFRSAVLRPYPCSAVPFTAAGAQHRR